MATVWPISLVCMATGLIDVIVGRCRLGRHRASTCRHRSRERLHRTLRVISTISADARKRDLKKMFSVFRWLKRCIKFPRKGKPRGLIKDDVAGNIHSSCFSIQIFVTLVIPTIPYEDTLLGPKRELFGVVGLKMGKASTPKGFEHVIVWFSLVTKKAFQGSGIVNDSCWETIN
jgi:hypothetical protein